MKTGRLLAYAITGIITGLIVENCALRLRAKAGKKKNEWKEKMGDKIARQ